MQSLVVSGGSPLKGETEISGSKNVALKAIVAALLTEDEVIINNVPTISDLSLMMEIASKLGVTAEKSSHTLKICAKNLKSFSVPIEMGALLRTSSMFIAPLLSRTGEAIIPNPGGCRIGARPIDRHIEGLKKMGVEIKYNEEDGYFHARVLKIIGCTYRFEKNTHTGTETLILMAVLASGKTILENAAQEPEVDDLINLLNSMGAKIKRTESRTIVIEGVSKLHGTEFTIMPDRNEIITFAIAALATKGDINIRNIGEENIKPFLEKISEAGGQYQLVNGGIRFFTDGSLNDTKVITTPFPGFMTDWQAPWVLLMTQAKGESEIYETIYENRFQYVTELKKMGAQIDFFNPDVEDPQKFYNFNWRDNKPEYFHAIKIKGPARLHSAVLNISDLRAGATLALAALVASGQSYLTGLEHLDRGYEKFEERLQKLGAQIKRIDE